MPKFRAWLTHLGAGEFVGAFLAAGYDLPFVAGSGLTEEDMDCVGIPAAKRGLRRKIMNLHELDQFYHADAAGGGDDEDDDDDEEEEEDEEEGNDDDEEEEEEDSD